VIYGSVCSGIEAASVAWKPLGWKASFFSEIEKFPCSVLDHHYPTVPNLGDMTKFKEWPDAIINVLVGGTPCQSFSIAGLRKGLDDPRGNLMLTYLAIAARYRPEWLVWENVPGVLSSNGGRDFGTFLGGLGQLGYGFAYRVLDAQHFGVPQRRRRVFVVGHSGDWRRAAAVLFEHHSLSGNPAPRREKGQDVAAGVIGGIDYEGNGHDRGLPTGPLLKGSPTGGGHALPAIAMITHSLRGEGFDASEDGTGRGTPLVPVPIQNATRGKDQNGLGIGGDVMFTLDQSSQHAVAFAQNQRDEVRMMHVAGALAAEPGMKQQTYIAQSAISWSEELTASVDCAGTIQRGGDGGRHDGVMTSSMQVRRLTPRECERLQGFPDDYTLIPGYNSKRTGSFGGNKGVADGPRYKALGNSFAVPVVRWIGERIAMVNRIRA